MDEIVKDLKERHPDEYSGPQLRLWARMICNGLHENLDCAPRVPMITGSGPKRQKQESLTDALIGAANAFAKVFKQQSSTHDTRGNSVSSAVRLSPCKAADLQMKHLEQLRYIQQVMEDGIISEIEFTEQKQIIIETLRKINY